VTFAGAAVTALFCWWLIPFSGMDGAAYAIVAGTLVMCLVMTWYSLKFFPVRYDWLKLSLLLAAGVALAWFQSSIWQFISPSGHGIALKAALLLLYSAFAVLLFREEAALVAAKVSGKFRREH
jgi:O-antigen/teichoic acid export membrane protein